MLRAGFIPDRPQRELRELTRYRRSLVQERSREANRVQKLLEGANIKLSSVATDVLGASGRAMLRAMSEGEEDPKASAELAKGRLREKLSDLEEALRGLVGTTSGSCWSANWAIWNARTRKLRGWTRRWPGGCPLLSQWWRRWAPSPEWGGAPLRSSRRKWART